MRHYGCPVWHLTCEGMGFGHSASVCPSIWSSSLSLEEASATLHSSPYNVLLSPWLFKWQEMSQITDKIWPRSNKRTILYFLHKSCVSHRTICRNEFDFSVQPLGLVLRRKS